MTGSAGQNYYGGAVNVYSSGRAARRSDAFGGDTGLGASGFGRIVGGNNTMVTGHYTSAYANPVVNPLDNGTDLNGGNQGYGSSGSYYVYAGTGGTGAGGGASRNTSSHALSYGCLLYTSPSPRD